jgi:ElaB/YqjD/DUF883 family membrane-anchored ribosome-binding protein
MTRKEAAMESSESHRKERGGKLAVRARNRLAPVDEWIRTQARERPFLVLGGALGAGYLIGRLLRRV